MMVDKKIFKRKGRERKKYLPEFAPSYVEVIQVKDGQFYKLPIVDKIRHDGNCIQVFVGGA